MSNEFRPAVTGVEYKSDRGKLYVFKPGRVQVMTCWPKPLAWEKSEAKPFWKNCRPNIRIPYGELDHSIARLSRRGPEIEKLRILFNISSREMNRRKDKRHFFQWANEIPLENRKLIGRYPERQWHMLSFLARCGDAANDLADSNRALAFMLASNWVFHKPSVTQPMRANRSLVKKKQRDALAWLGFPKTEAARRILKKIIYPSVRVKSLLYLRQAMLSSESRDIMRLLYHLPKLNSGTIRIITDPTLRNLSSPKLLEEISNDRLENNTPKTAGYLKNCKDLLDLIYPKGHKKGPYQSKKRILELHKSLLRELKKLSLHENAIGFRKPPFEGNQNIIPITNSRMLLDEGEMQKNCVAHFIIRIVTYRNYYVYRVLSPERCTLGISHIGDRWILHDLRTRDNGPVNDETLIRVGEWLHQQGVMADFQFYHEYNSLQNIDHTDETNSHNMLDYETLLAEGAPF